MTNSDLLLKHRLILYVGCLAVWMAAFLNISAVHKVPVYPVLFFSVGTVALFGLLRYDSLVKKQTFLSVYLFMLIGFGWGMAGYSFYDMGKGALPHIFVLGGTGFFVTGAMRWLNKIGW
jgi:hypothetical protein